MASRPAPAGPIDALGALVGTETQLLALLDGIGSDDWEPDDRAAMARPPHRRSSFDLARELTERWHHQQQIRLALDRPAS